MQKVQISTICIVCSLFSVCNHICATLLSLLDNKCKKCTWFAFVVCLKVCVRERVLLLYIWKCAYDYRESVCVCVCLSVCPCVYIWCQTMSQNPHPRRKTEKAAFPPSTHKPGAAHQKSPQVPKPEPPAQRTIQDTPRHCRCANRADRSCLEAPYRHTHMLMCTSESRKSLISTQNYRFKARFITFCTNLWLWCFCTMLRDQKKYENNWHHRIHSIHRIHSKQKWTRCTMRMKHNRWTKWCKEWQLRERKEQEDYQAQGGRMTS